MIIFDLLVIPFIVVGEGMDVRVSFDLTASDNNLSIIEVIDII